MATGSLQINRDIILATKRQYIKERMRTTPVEAVLSLAQMQQRPRSLLNYSTDRDKIFVVAQVTRTEVYDPVTSALHCLANGAHAIIFFTDHTIYNDDLDDMLMVARGARGTSVIYQNYILDEYSVMSARAADASGLVLYSSLMEPQKLRQVVSMTQRWKMFAMLQVNDGHELDFALTLSPHALCFGDNLSSRIERTVEDLRAIRHTLPNYIKVMLMHTLYTIEDVQAALTADVDALIVSEELLKNEKYSGYLRELVAEAEAARVQKASGG